MRHPWANTTILTLIIVQLLTGSFGLITGSERWGWVMALHSIGGFAIVVLLLWKGAVVAHSLRMRRTLVPRAAFLALAALLLGVLGTGITWGVAGRTLLDGYSLLTIHILLALAMLPVLGWHVLHMGFILRRSGALGRRAFLRLVGVSLAGLTLWQLGGKLTSTLGLPGAYRRFTGSYEVGSFSGDFPVVSWLFDRPGPVDVVGWRLTIVGAVEHPLVLAYSDLLELAQDRLTAVLDCTGGWYSIQEWTGIEVGRLLDMARVHSRARSVIFEAVSGYHRRFPLEDARGYLLAVAVAGRPLEHSHGFPARLVAPDHRGYDWVKWVTRIEVNESSHLLQPPVPLQ